jgi:hypothetical protein
MQVDKGVCQICEEPCSPDNPQCVDHVLPKGPSPYEPQPGLTASLHRPLTTPHSFQVRVSVILYLQLTSL